MEDSSYHSDSSLPWPPRQDVEGQYYEGDLDEAEDGTPIEFMNAHTIDPTSDRLFTNVPLEDHDDISEQEHDPIWQPRGGHTLTIQEQQAEIEERSHAQFREFLETVQLFQGNFIIDCPIAPRLLSEIPHAQPPVRDEFTHMRYTAVTCDPIDFRTQRYTLRPMLFAQPRKIELLVAVTMYNEDELLLGNTIRAVMKNIQYLCSQTLWGSEAWKQVLVCIISDGRKKINPKCLALLTGLGVFQDDIAKREVDHKEVTAHLYEYTSQVRIEIAGDRVKVKARNKFPCQILFCLKEKNQKKVNSHRWLFQAFGDVLGPGFCILLDAGTVPVRHAFYGLWDTLRRDSHCGCAVGEYKTMSRGSLFNPLVAMQHFEFKMKNLLDRPLESLFGHRFDTSGALIAYKYIALLNDRFGVGPLQEYFHSDNTAFDREPDVFHSNMGLAEDRILTFALVNKKDCLWRMLYVASAYAVVDVPTSLAEFLMQRRRWLNGNTFASLYALAHFTRLLGTAHSVPRKIALTAQFAHQAISMCLSWFSLSLFFLTFHIVTISTSGDVMYGRAGHISAQFFGALYFMNLFFGFILAMGNRPVGNGRLYMCISHVWTLIMIYMIFALITLIVTLCKNKDYSGPATVSKFFQRQLFWSLVIPIMLTYAVWLIVSVLFLSPWHMITSLIQYILFIPTSINLVSVYAFCNLHDVSWHIKSDSTPALLSVSQTRPGAVKISAHDIDLDELYDASLALLGRDEKSSLSFTNKSPEDYFQGFRTLIVFTWVCSNFILTATILNISSTNQIKFGSALQTTQGSVIFIAIVFWRIAGDALFKFAGVVAYLVLNTCWQKGN